MFLLWGATVMVSRLIAQVGARSRPNDPNLGVVLVAAVVILGVLFNAAVGLLSLLAPTGFLAAVGQASPSMTPATSVFAEYAGARELAIAVALIVCAASRIAPALAGVLVVAATANTLDAVEALASGRWLQLPGALLFAMAFTGAAIWFARRTRQSADSASGSRGSAET